MKNQKPNKPKNGIAPDAKVKVDGNVSKSVIVSGDNNAVSYGEKETESNSLKQEPHQKISETPKKIDPVIIVALITAVASIIVAVITHLLNNKP